MVSIKGIIHLKPGSRVLTYFPNLNFKALLYSKIIRIPASKNSRNMTLNNNGGFIILRFNVIFYINCKTPKSQNSHKESQPFSFNMLTSKRKQKASYFSYRFPFKVTKFKLYSKAIKTILNRRHHCFDYKKTLSLKCLNHLK